MRKIAFYVRICIILSKLFYVAVVYYVEEINYAGLKSNRRTRILKKPIKVETKHKKSERKTDEEEKPYHVSLLSTLWKLKSRSSDSFSLSYRMRTWSKLLPFDLIRSYVQSFLGWPIKGQYFFRATLGEYGPRRPTLKFFACGFLCNPLPSSPLSLSLSFSFSRWCHRPEIYRTYM